MKKLSGMEQSGKLEVLQDLMDQMESMMGNDLDAKKKMKATVVASSKEGLQKGLDKAEDVVAGEEMDSSDEDSIGGEGIMDESEEDLDMKAPEDCSPEELQEKIAELEAILAAKTKKSDVKMPF